jgi:hypothetical protein
MKKTLIAAAVLGLGLLAAPASAAGHMPPGKTIQESCGTSFGQLVGPAKAAGDSAHPNYAGGANAFVGVAVVHGCAG